MPRLCTGAVVHPALWLILSGAGCIPNNPIPVPDFSPGPGGPSLDGGTDGSPMQGEMGAAGWQLDKSAGVTSTLRAVWVSDAALTNAYVVGAGGTILHRTANGSWTAETSGTTQDLYGVLGLSGDEVYAAGGNGVILHRQAGNWKMETSTPPVTAGLYGLAMTGAGDLMVVGDGGTIVHGTGGTWKTETSPVNADLRGVSGSSTSDMYAVGAGATILHRDSNGWAVDTATLQDADKGNYFAVTSLMNTVFLAGDYGRVLRRDTGKWVAEPTVMPAQQDMGGAPANFYGLYGTGSELYAVGSGGMIQRRSGMTWNIETVNTVNDFYGVSGGGVHSILAVGAMGTVARRY